MKIGIAVFAYNRSRHLQQVFKGLQRNGNIEKLYIFQDGLKSEEHREEWEKVKEAIDAVSWCKKKCYFSDVNKGLARSIIEGVNCVFEENDAVIVLEDDCVPHPGFMIFMTTALQKYQEKRDVYSVNGYAYPVSVGDNGTDAYFTRRTSSWGWGTWKDRWEQYEQDYKILGRIKKNEKLTEDLEIWGADLESYLLGNVYGNCDSWAVFWGLSVIEKGGYCCSPYKSLIKNIGFDGTGVHCGVQKLEQYLYEEEKKSFLLPDIVELPEAYEVPFRDHFSWTSTEQKQKTYNELLVRWVNTLMDHKESIADRLINKGVSRCSIWGKGPLCDLLQKEFRGKIEILSIIESHPAEKEYRGIPIVNINEIPKETQVVLVIPIYDFYKIKRMAEKVTDCKIVPLDFIFESEKGT